jgi:hypothetical protein
MQIASASHAGESYCVEQAEDGAWSCTCRGHSFRGTCRHVEEVKAMTTEGQMGMLTFSEAVSSVERLTHGLHADEVDRLLERVAASPDPERLRAMLAKLGAAALLGRTARRPAFTPRKVIVG